LNRNDGDRFSQSQLQALGCRLSLDAQFGP
jgi:hypothetical protein